MSKLIVDVSYHNGVIDWAKVKAAGIQGAIIRCGYGDNIASQDDKQFKRNADECTRLGIPWGVYIYSYAKTTAQAKSEAAHALRLVAPYKGKMSYPIYYDLEQRGTESVAVQNGIVFGDIVEAAGYWCGIYSGQYWYQKYIGNRLDRFTKWVARYSSQKPVGISGSYDMWQYSSSGSVPGINGRVDMNEVYRDFPSEILGGGSSGGNGPRQVPGNPINDMGVKYRAHCQTIGDCAEVRDGQTAGTTGFGKRLEALYISLEEAAKKLGVDLKLRGKCHIQGTGWVDLGYITKDTMIGSKGQSKRLEAIILEIEGLPEGYELQYRTHIQTIGWTGWVASGFASGSVGFKKGIEAIQIRLIKK